MATGSDRPVPRPDHRAIWQRALELLRDTCEPNVYETYFADTHSIEVRGGVLHVGVPTAISPNPAIQHVRADRKGG